MGREPLTPHPPTPPTPNPPPQNKTQKIKPPKKTVSPSPPLPLSPSASEVPGSSPWPRSSPGARTPPAPSCWPWRRRSSPRRRTPPRARCLTSPLAHWRGRVLLLFWSFSVVFLAKKGGGVLFCFLGEKGGFSFVFLAKQRGEGVDMLSMVGVSFLMSLLLFLLFSFLCVSFVCWGGKTCVMLLNVFVCCLFCIVFFLEGGDIYLSVGGGVTFTYTTSPNHSPPLPAKTSYFVSSLAVPTPYMAVDQYSYPQVNIANFSHLLGRPSLFLRFPLDFGAWLLRETNHIRPLREKTKYSSSDKFPLKPTREI